MQDTIDMKKYSTVKEQFAVSKNINCMIRAMLSLERLWTPFLYSTSKNNWDIQEQEKLRICMDGIWQRIFLNQVDDSRKEYYTQILDEIDEKYCNEDGLSEFCYDHYLYHALASGFEWFFGENVEKRPDIVLCTTELIHDKIVDDNIFKNEQEKVTYFSQNPYMLSELKRIDEDYEISKIYPQNKEKIVELRKKYQSMWIIPIGGKI